ncbi:MAG: site-specific DNA-methyltransferase [Vulcanimicrobiota bacterium]
MRTNPEKFELNWPGKTDMLNKLNSKPIGEIIWERSYPKKNQDLLIEGNNLEALKNLALTHENLVKFIYIDPPYNTGNSFTYNDNFQESPRSHKNRVGNHGNSSARKHSLWLNMMYPRLYWAKKLLKNDGVIFISIDDSELAQLTLLMDEIFDEENRVGIITWVKKKKGSHLSRSLRSITEYILVYGKQASGLNLYGEDAYRNKWQPLLKRVNKEKTLHFKANVVETTLAGNFYPKGLYGSGGTRVELMDDINIKNGLIINSFAIKARTVWTQEKLNQELQLGTRVSIRSVGMGPNVFRHDQLKKKKAPPSLLDFRVGVGTNEDASRELLEIFGLENIYSYPKPVSLIKYLARTVSRYQKDGIFLDFFAGSGTTGQAIWELNREDGGRRNFILIQSAEKMNPQIELANGERVNTISELCRTRLDRVKQNETFIPGRLS